jgi:hypothetical protein
VPVWNVAGGGHAVLRGLEPIDPAEMRRHPDLAANVTPKIER